MSGFSSITGNDPQVVDIAGLTPTNNGVIIGNGTNFVVETSPDVDALSIGGDVNLKRDAANILTMRNAANNQRIWVANTYTDASNNEFLQLGFNGNTARIQNFAQGTGSARDMVIQSDGTLLFSPQNDSTIGMQANVMYPTSDINVDLGTTTSRFNTLYSEQLTLIDGITEPTTVTGHAVIYVDNGDGDLKIKFGDGTVKTIITDT